MCGYTLCRNCKKIVKEDSHKCYMQPVYTKHGCENHYIFFDYEAKQETGVHNPNLIIAQYFDGKHFILEPMMISANG